MAMKIETGLRIELDLTPTRPRALHGKQNRLLRALVLAEVFESPMLIQELRINFQENKIVAVVLVPADDVRLDNLQAARSRTVAKLDALIDDFQEPEAGEALRERPRAAWEKLREAPTGVAESCALTIQSAGRAVPGKDGEVMVSVGRDEFWVSAAGFAADRRATGQG